jgi:hypothetical protein
VHVVGVPFQLVVLRAGRKGDRRLDGIAHDKNFRAVRQTRLSSPGYGQRPESTRPGDLFCRRQVRRLKNQHAVTLKRLL